MNKYNKKNNNWQYYWKSSQNMKNNFKELERYQMGFGKDGVGFEWKPENFKTGTVTLRDAKKFIAGIVSNDKQVWIDLLII